MITLNRILTCVLVGVVFLSCSKEIDSESENASLTVSDIGNLKHQLPNPLHDTSVEGIYHGVVASASTQSRGKIWVNVANNSNFNALIELVDGDTFTFSITPETVAETATMTIFEFVSDNAYFTLDLTQPDMPEISNIVLLNESFHGRVVKSRSNSSASSTTATFTEAGNPSFSGTWNLIADGSIFNPNGNNGDGITSVLITINGDLVEDFDLNSFNAMSCLGSTSYVPTLNSYGTTNYTVCDYQNTSFAGGTAKWYLSYDAFAGNYMNYFSCETAINGTFAWTSADGTITRLGSILLD